MFDIKVKNKIIKSLGDKTIFEIAQENNLIIEHSCLSGRCSNCKAKVISGTTTLVKEELGLTEEERANNFILTCVRKPQSDIELDVEIFENANFNQSRTVPAKITSIVKITSDVIKVTLRLPPNTEFNFLAGQYVNIIKSNIKRSYSIAGYQEMNSLFFYIKKHESGLMSKYLFDEAKENDLLRIEGPKGSFFLRGTILDNLIFLATGTGIAPILSILKSPLNYEMLKKKNIYIFHGGRFKDDLIEQDFFKNWGVNYYPTLSREKVEGYYFGYIQKNLLNEPINLKLSTVYACGSEIMINDAKELLIKNGLHAKEFYSDAFLESN